MTLLRMSCTAESKLWLTRWPLRNVENIVMRLSMLGSATANVAKWRCSRGLTLNDPADGLRQAMYCVLLMTLSVSLCRSYLYSHGPSSYGLCRSYLYSHGPSSHGLCRSYLYNYGPSGYGLYRSYLVIARVVMACADRTMSCGRCVSASMQSVFVCRTNRAVVG